MTWTETQPAGNVSPNWASSAVSADGQTFFAGIDGGSLFIGSNPLSFNSSTSSGVSMPSAPGCGDAALASAPNLFQLQTKGNSVTLYFTPDSGPNSGYYIGYRFDDIAQNFGTTFNYTNGGGAVAYTINDLFPGTWYFKVHGQNGCIPGDWSSVMKVNVTKSGTHTVNAING